MAELLQLDNDEDDMSSDDEEYVPDAGEAVSEEEESGEDEGNEASDKVKNKKVSKQQSGTTRRKRTGGIKLEGESDEADNDDRPNDQEDEKLNHDIEAEKQLKKEELQKKKADDLWASFLGDVGTKPKPKTGSSYSESISKSIFKATFGSPASTVKKNDISAKKNEKVTVTKIFDFAGETVEVTKKVDADSNEAKQAKSNVEESKTEPIEPEKPSPIPGMKRPGGGLGSVLGKIGKKPKISTLNKSKLDWDNFKEKEGISEELQTHNRGKGGYLERKAFLERTDLRQFEIEKNLRSRKK